MVAAGRLGIDRLVDDERIPLAKVSTGCDYFEGGEIGVPIGPVMAKCCMEVVLTVGKQR